jgi:hypothetical protein
MSVAQLDKADQALLRSCLEFVLDNSELRGEFETRLGISQQEIRGLIDRWPDARDEDDQSAAAIGINNALNEIVHGLRVSASDERTIGASRGAVQALYFRWAKLRGWSASGMR